MRKKLIPLILICLTVLLTFSMIGCNNTSKKVSSEKDYEQTIEEKLYNITHPKDSKVLLSSNPYDYIKGEDTKKDYNYIVSQGTKSFDYMLSKFATSNTNGLEEYIMAIACSEILGEDDATKSWTTGREWYENYIKTKN